MFRTRYLELSMFHPMVLCALPNVERRAMSSAAVFLYLYSIAGKIEAKYVQDDHVRRCIATCSIMRSRVQQSYHLTHRGSMRRGSCEIHNMWPNKNECILDLNLPIYVISAITVCRKASLLRSWTSSSRFTSCDSWWSLLGKCSKTSCGLEEIETIRNWGWIWEKCFLSVWVTEF